MLRVLVPPSRELLAFLSNRNWGFVPSRRTYTRSRAPCWHACPLPTNSPIMDMHSKTLCSTEVWHAMPYTCHAMAYTWTSELLQPPTPLAFAERCPASHIAAYLFICSSVNKARTRFWPSSSNVNQSNNKLSMNLSDSPLGLSWAAFLTLLEAFGPASLVMSEMTRSSQTPGVDIRVVFISTHTGLVSLSFVPPVKWHEPGTKDMLVGMLWMPMAVAKQMFYLPLPPRRPFGMLKPPEWMLAGPDSRHGGLLASINWGEKGGWCSMSFTSGIQNVAHERRPCIDYTELYMIICSMRSAVYMCEGPLLPIPPPSTLSHRPSHDLAIVILTHRIPANLIAVAIATSQTFNNSNSRVLNFSLVGLCRRPYPQRQTQTTTLGKHLGSLWGFWEGRGPWGGLGGHVGDMGVRGRLWILGFILRFLGAILGVFWGPSWGSLGPPWRVLGVIMLRMLG